uniref:Uncharacterized protein n=1 Tax=Microcoleus asticus IPMA8 TaxID=2563858 RepID=A0ABX2D6B5_9CYAN|nr:hypothetical protein [Microcoleus asticus IPMA8]
MIQDVAHVSVSKKLYDLLVPQNVTILEMSKIYKALGMLALLKNAFYQIGLLPIN